MRALSFDALATSDMGSLKWLSGAGEDSKATLRPDLPRPQSALILY